MTMRCFLINLKFKPIHAGQEFKFNLKYFNESMNECNWKSSIIKIITLKIQSKFKIQNLSFMCSFVRVINFKLKHYASGNKKMSKL
jgi:hypothetical protein